MKHAIAALLVLAPALSAQQSGKPGKFEVASVKASPPGGHIVGAVHQTYCGLPYGSSMSALQLTLVMCTVHDLVARAWSVREDDLRLPRDQPWISNTKYDINAKSASPVSPRDQWRMLGPLLEDRFGLKWHREKQEAQVYFVTVAKGGLKLPATAAGSCTAWKDHNYPPPPPMPNKPPTCDYPLMPGTPDRRGLGIDGTGLTMPTLVGLLTSLLRRTVIDRTGFTAPFDLHIRFARDSVPSFGLAPDGEPSGLPDIFTAIRKAGLAIVSGKGPVDVLVVDSVQKPSEN